MKKHIKSAIFLLTINGLILGLQNDIRTINGLRDDTNTESSDSQSPPRETIILWEEDFESGENGWNLGTGWELTETSYHSASHSILSANDDDHLSGSFNLLSPVIDLPEINENETLYFAFWLYANLPDSDGDGDDYLDDYYSISLLDLGALAWHSTNFNDDLPGADGSNFWAGDEEIGGYLDSWIQYLDTPSILVGDNGSISAKIYYAIEDYAGASSGGSCTDGWDAANIRISNDGGTTWDLVEDNNNPYHFDCGYGWIYNDDEYEIGGSLNHLAPGWGGISGIEINDHGSTTWTESWLDFSADLNDYAGQDIIVRFAFGSDPAFSTANDSEISGFQIDEIKVTDDSGILFEDNGGDLSQMSPSGEVWTEQFYDYADEGRPGVDDWEEYTTGLAFNGNIAMDISDFSEQSVMFRIQTRYDDNHDGGQGLGLFIDDFYISKYSGIPPPSDFTAEPGDGEVILSWTHIPFTTVNVYRTECDENAGCGNGVGEMIASGIPPNSYVDSDVSNNITYAYSITATFFNGDETEHSDVVIVTPIASTVHEEGYDDGSFESQYNTGYGNYSAVKFTACSEGEDVLRFKWFQFGPVGAFYLKIFEDVDGAPGSELYSQLLASGSLDGWNELDLSGEDINVSGNFWVGTKEFSTSRPFGLDISSNTGNSYENLDDGWIMVDGNLSYHIFLDSVNCYLCNSSGSGDVTGDGEVNVADIVVIATAIIENGFEDDCATDTGDVNGDGYVDVVDIVALVTQILAPRIDIPDAIIASIIKSNNSLSVDANGFIGGLQMTLEHSENFSMNITNQAMISNYRTEGNITNILIVMPESNELFTYEGDFKILDLIVVNSKDRIEASLINIPHEYSLNRAYPNPFNPMTTISFSIPLESTVSLSVYNLQGREVGSLLNRNIEAGYHSITWDANSYTSGVYFVKMIAGEFISTQKLMLIK